jgi:rhodanese-related sulfurtransferase
MKDPQTILGEARERARALSLPYAGALPPREAFELWKGSSKATLVDVRTRAEWNYVGRIPGAIEIEWNHYPSGRNPGFAEELQAAVPDLDAPLLFICRSGNRSGSAAEAARALGYANAINVLEGFEGDLDSERHRNSVGGWRKAGLPWTQS